MSLQLFTAALALAGVANAMPANEPPKKGAAHNEAHGNFSYIIDPWTIHAPAGKQAGDVGSALEAAIKGATAAATHDQRDESPPPNAGGYKGLIPGCDADPSYIKPKKTKYHIDQGVKVPKNGDNDECTTGHNSDHCWTEYYLVEQAIEYSNWREQGAGVDCAGTSLCDSSSAGLKQSCTSIGTTSTDGYDVKIAEGAISFEIDLGLIKASPSISGPAVTVTHSTTNSKIALACTATTDTTTCHWDDKKCHQLWVADRVMRVWGQQQRVCIGSSSSTQQSTKNSRGHYVRGQGEFEFTVPINTLQGCGALCSDHSYGLALPKPGERHPFTKPTGW